MHLHRRSRPNFFRINPVIGHKGGLTFWKDIGKGEDLFNLYEND